MIIQRFFSDIYYDGNSIHRRWGKLTLILAGMLMLFSCQTKVATDLPPDLLNTKSLPAMEATNFETFYSDSGVVKYHVQTPKLVIYENPSYEDFPDGFMVQKYDINKKIVSQLSGNHGKYFESEGKWEANGNVIMLNSQGDTLKSEELKYDEKKDLIYSDQFVSVKKGDQYLTGSGGFKSDSQMSNMTFLKTKGHLYVEGE